MNKAALLVAIFEAEQSGFEFFAVALRQVLESQEGAR
jgi:hypothetical protein